MKYCFVFVCLVFTLFADDMQRLESMLKDIRDLKIKYEECKNTMAEKSSQHVIDLVCKETKNDELKKYKKLLKSKEEKIKSLKNKLKEKSKTQIIIKEKYENPNKFPKLALKAKYINKKQNIKKEECIHIKPSVFRLKSESKIYDAISGKEIDYWEKGRSFTSDTASEKWIKITGYFVDRKWTKAKNGMWIEKTNVLKR